MRRPREATPPRRPRVMTWRLVVVSLVVGVVLAVVSVPASVAIGRIPWIAGMRHENEQNFMFRGEVVTVTTSRGPMGSRIDVTTVPAFAAHLPDAPETWRNARPVDHDPRPHAVRAWADRGEWVYTRRVGWPLEATQTHMRIDLAALMSSRGSLPASVHVGEWNVAAFGS